MRKKPLTPLLLSLILLFTSASSCSNNKQLMINKACEQVENAWAINNYYTPKYKLLRDGYWKSAAEYFRQLAAEDSGFSKFAAKANEALNSKITNYEEFYEMINFCGIDS